MRGISERVLKHSEEGEEVFEREQMRVFDSVFERSESTTGKLEEMHRVDETVFEEKNETEKGKAEQPEEEERKTTASSRELPSREKQFEVERKIIEQTQREEENQRESGDREKVKQLEGSQHTDTSLGGLLRLATSAA